MVVMNVQLDKQKHMENEKEQTEPERAEAERVEAEIIYSGNPLTIKVSPCYYVKNIRE